MDLIKQISSKGLVLDGAMSTALEKQGIDTNTDLWTAVALDKDLDKVYKVHMNYFQAGAQMAITDTYQANVQAFEKHGYSEDKAKEMIADAVKTARQSAPRPRYLPEAPWALYKGTVPAAPPAGCGTAPENPASDAAARHRHHRKRSWS